MEIKGTVEEIIYQNEVNSYTICTFQTDEELITTVRISSIYYNRRYFKFNWKIRKSPRIWQTI